MGSRQRDMDMDDEQPKAMRQATCIEVLVFLIWYALVMNMVQAQYESDGWLTATTVRESLLDSKISSFTDSTFENVYDATTFNQWASNVFIPWTIGLANPTFDGSCSTEQEDGSTKNTRPIWDWSATCTRSAKFARAGPILWMQTSDEQYPVNQTGTNGTSVEFSEYQDLSARVLDFNSFEGQYGSYPPKGYFRLWPVNMTYAEAQDDLLAMGCSQGTACEDCLPQDPNYKSCFGCGCQTQGEIAQNGYQNTWFHPDFSNNIAVVVLLVNDDRIILLKMLFEIDKPILGWGWSPSYKVGSIKKIRVAYFGIVYLLTFLFMLFSFKQVKDQRWDYLTSIWNWFDAINLSLFIASFYQSIVYMGKYSDITGPDSDSIDATTMYSLWMPSKAQSSIMLLYGVNMLIMNLKLIKYIQALDFIPGLAMPIAAMQEAGIEMFDFMFTLIITSLGFAQTFTAWFGDQVYNYNTSKTSFITMLLALTGYPAFDDLGFHSFLFTFTFSGFNSNLLII